MDIVEEDGAGDDGPTKTKVAPPKAIPQGFDGDGRRIIPPQLQAEFTTNEGEELIALFESADEDKSGSVDEQEFRKLLVRMDICIADDEVDKLVVEVDTNNNGLIEWDEFVSPYDDLVLQNAGKFGLSVAFRLLEERKATSYNPKTYVMQVTIMTSERTTESYEAIGFSSREAKFKVAELALVKMRKMKPGFEFPAGVIPPTWDDWTFNNLNKGVAPLKVLKTLVDKGFTPAENLTFMKRVSVHVSYLHVKATYPDTALVYPSSMALTTPWCRWVDEQVARGMDGPLVLHALCHNGGGYNPSKDPHFVQRLTKMGATSPYDFWQCVHAGNLAETKLFVCGGQNVNEEKLDRHAKTAYTPLQLAAKHGYLNIVEYLLQHGADVGAANSFRRTALLFAARHGHPAVIKLLLRHGASILDRDNLDNTPLHMAAMAGCTRYLRSCIVNINKSLSFMDESNSFRGILRRLFGDMMHAKLPRNVRPTFALAWLPEAVDLAYTVYIEQCFLEAYKNTPNRQGRTPLHLACDENLVCTHEGAVRTLVDMFGCDTHIQDNMGRTPLELLLQRKHRPGSPKDNRELEVTLQSARHRRRTNHAVQRQLAKDAVKRRGFEESLLQQLPRQPYEDGLSHNHFYEHIHTGQLQLHMPDDVRAALELRKQWYVRKLSARLLEKRGTWTMHKHAKKQRVFFYNTETGQYQWTKPAVIDGWVNIPPNIKRTLESSPDLDEEDSDDEEEGEHREAIDQVSQKLLRVFGSVRKTKWEEHHDAVTGGRVYYNTDTRQLTRTKPDAVYKDELKRQAYTLLIQTAQFKDREAMSQAAQDATGQLVRRITDEELSKQRDSEQWLHVLQRARRRDTLKTLVKKDVVDEATRRLNDLNDSVLRKIHADFGGQTMGYRDARIATEQQALRKARALGLFVSEKIVVPLTRASVEAMEMTQWLQGEEAESQSIEDTDANPSDSARRRLVRLMEDAAWRLDGQHSLCFWGCRLWSLVGSQKDDHEHDECKRRLMVCRLGCPVVHEAFQWQQSHGGDHTELEWHELYECNSRLIKCPRDCGAWVPNDALQHHTDFTCVKRPVPDLECRVGCGKVFNGANNRILELEQERKWHEMEACPDRIVVCAWPGCQEAMKAKDRPLHRKSHLCASGITTFKTNGSFNFVVPKDCKHIKVQAWGAGGGSGVLHGYKFGHGGGGAFVEAICPVHPGEVLFRAMIPLVGQAFGGLPGGGSGHSSNNGWACGGGGGYTSICRKGPFGIQTLLLVGGGGGGGCRAGLGGGDDQPIDESVKVDARNGGMGSTPLQGGSPGQVSTPNPAFGATGGQLYQGGSGAEFGGGGGGGYFGGGGGGFSPGIVGGGGGGSTLVDRSLVENVVVEKADKRVPGGVDRHPPAPTDDDDRGGVSGEGGLGTLRGVCAGNDGCVRVALPGFYSNMDFDTVDVKLRGSPSTRRLSLNTVVVDM
ncbi:hypothetical protein DYB31_001906 [Aphanomyces astaci]|uniref:Uncharacterized protein n=2 Tax=Aphanomyces astaci TaxID=112090 RepID=A0A397FUB8_APHAT|nr:hypothetical protein DYB31_001906 [Aphanomyces astaci]